MLLYNENNLDGNGSQKSGQFGSQKSRPVWQPKNQASLAAKKVGQSRVSEHGLWKIQDNLKPPKNACKRFVNSSPIVGSPYDHSIKLSVKSFWRVDQSIYMSRLQALIGNRKYRLI